MLCCTQRPVHMFLHTLLVSPLEKPFTNEDFQSLPCRWKSSVPCWRCWSYKLPDKSSRQEGTWIRKVGHPFSVCVCVCVHMHGVGGTYRQDRAQSLTLKMRMKTMCSKIPKAILKQVWMAGRIKPTFVSKQIQTYKYIGNEGVDRTRRLVSERHPGFWKHW